VIRSVRKVGATVKIGGCVRLLIGVASIVAASVLSYASCFGPMISVGASEGEAGTRVTINGKYFVDGCHDVCINGKCPPTFPAKGVKILFIQDERIEEVGRVDANDKFEISVTVKVPENALAGSAQFVAETLYEGHNLRTPKVSFTVKAGR